MYVFYISHGILPISKESFSIVTEVEPDIQSEFYIVSEVEVVLTKSVFTVVQENELDVETIVITRTRT